MAEPPAGDPETEPTTLGSTDDTGFLYRNRAALPGIHPGPSTPELDTASIRGAPVPRGGLSFRHYSDVETLDQGGMGTILHAIDTDLGRQVAIKVLRSDAWGMRELRRRFLREARVTGQLQHPGIPPIHELSTTEAGEHFFAMELVTGKNLARILRERAAEGDEAIVSARRELLGWFLRVCEAVAYAHSRGVVHRDLKPANIMIGDFGKVYVLDWGLALILDEAAGEGRVEDPTGGLATTEVHSSPRLTLHGTVLGTPTYMAPEQVGGRIWAIGPATDVYQLGVILYEILTLRVPFVGQTTDGILAAVEGGGAEPPSRRAPHLGIPASLDAVVEKAMAHRPQDRYPGVDALRADIEAFLGSRELSVVSYRPWGLFLLWVRRNRLASAFAAAGVAIAVALGAVIVWRLDRERAAALDHARAEEARREASERRGLVDRDLIDARWLETEADRLWPIHTVSVEALATWVEETERRTLLLDDRRRALGRADLESVERRTLQEAVELLARLDRILPELRRRLDWARRVRQVESTGDEAWKAALADIADPSSCPAYGGLALRRQAGLAPIGRDPASGLWEFAHLPSGSVPSRDPAGRLAIDEGTAVVLVLVPGGNFRPGDLGPEPFDQDDESQPDEAAAGSVRLAPFFVSRFELTRAQWERIGGALPPANPGRPTDPVALVSWEDCETILGRAGLAFPTEAQWEYAARAEPPGEPRLAWFAGSSRLFLRGAANLADLDFARAAKFPEGRFDKDLEDGSPGPAPVGSFRPNRFGLHDVLGNVAEWCRDGYGAYDEPCRPEDGERIPALGRGAPRVHRGGAFDSLPREARSGARSTALPAARLPRLGVRPARPVE